MRKPRCSWIHDHKPWTRQEEDYLRANRGTMTNKAMAAALPGRTMDAVSCRCRHLGLYKRDLRPPAPVAAISKRALVRWTADEVAILERHAGRLRPKVICYLFLPERTPAAVDVKIRQLGLPLWPKQSDAPAQADLQVAA